MIPIVSVVTPTYNRRHTLPRVWESLSNQSEQRFEWIIVDDGSTDGTKDWVEEVGDLRISYIKQDNQGMQIARNRGAQLVKGKFTIFMDSDDEFYDHETLEVMVADIENSKNDIGMVWYRRVDSRTGRPSDVIEEDSLIPDFQDHVCDRIAGDFFSIERNEVTMKYPWPPWRRIETRRWWSILREYSVMVRTRPSLVYHWDSGNNLSNFSGMMKYTSNLADAYRELIDNFTTDWELYCSCQIGKYNFYLAGYEVMSGRWIEPVPPLLKAFRYGTARIKISALVLLFCIPLPRTICAQLLYLRNRSRAYLRRRGLFVQY